MKVPKTEWQTQRKSVFHQVGVGRPLLPIVTETQRSINQVCYFKNVTYYID